MEGLRENNDNNTTSLPSPPSSVNATDPDNSHKDGGPQSEEAAGNESSDGAHAGANTGTKNMAYVVGMQADRYSSWCGV